MDEQKKDLGTQGQKDTLKGKMKQAGGKIQSKAGQVTGNADAEAQGDIRQAEGKAQSKAGHVEKKVDKIIDPDK